MHVITAPSNLGLSPLRPGHEPGTWRAPAALFSAGLLGVLGTPSVVALPRPEYSPDVQPGTCLRSGHAMRDFNLALAAAVHDVHHPGSFTLVVGGDCSILLGALAGARRSGPLSLVHVDGHSDFRHPGNADPAQAPYGVAGMDLALATGRGDALGTEWPGIAGPLVADTHVIQLGERENREINFAFPDVNDTAFERIDVFDALAVGAVGVVARVASALARIPEQAFWLHLDLDVLDQAVMPAIDCPGSPGIDPDDLVRIIDPLVVDRRCCGMTLACFDPDLDPDGRYADLVVSMLARLSFPSLTTRRRSASQ